MEFGLCTEGNAKREKEKRRWVSGECVKRGWNLWCLAQKRTYNVQREELGHSLRGAKLYYMEERKESKAQEGKKESSRRGIRRGFAKFS